MNYAMPSVLGHTFTQQAWAELNRLRLASRHRDRRKRARELAAGIYARLGSDHPALLMRELAHGMATKRIETARGAQSMQQWCIARGRLDEAAKCADHAASDLAESKQWVALYVLLVGRAKRVIVSHLNARIAHLLRMAEANLAPAIVTVEQPRAARHSALASHLAPQAPPLGLRAAFNAVTTRPNTPERRKKKPTG